jgi:hypothetical protein
MLGVYNDDPVQKNSGSLSIHVENLLVPKTINGVVVNHTNRLHEGIANGGTDKMKAALPKILTYLP